MFGQSIKSRVGSDFHYADYFSMQLAGIRIELQNDLEQGIRDNDYITDPNKDYALRTVENLEKCKISCYDLERKINSLAWFVGGVLFALVGDAIGDNLVDWVFELIE